MATSNHITPGMTISLNGKLYRVESSVKVTVAKGTPFIKTKLRDLATDEVIEKNFKLNQAVKDVSLVEKRLEFLYLEGKDYLFLDIGNLEHVLVPPEVIGDNVQFLKEGIELKATLYGDTVFSVELPQFLELMVTKTDVAEQGQNTGGSKRAVLETGAKIDVPPFVESGDIIKVDTKNSEYIQRV
jgi:elongation factor P